jgi:WD40 repeat protein
MNHTYLRYECADSFGLVTDNAPQASNDTLAWTTPSAFLVATAGSRCTVYNPKTSQAICHIGHVDNNSSIGTGRAMNSDHVVCLCVREDNLATGWTDGAVRVFRRIDAQLKHQLRSGGGPVARSLLRLEDNDAETNHDQEPLVLQGHGESPVRAIAFDDKNRLASGGSDGSVVVWDIVAETGLFRLLGHRGGITSLCFVNKELLDALISSSLDGLVKIWELSAQCCIQTLVNNGRQVMGADLTMLWSGGDEETKRLRLLTGASDGQVRVWSVHTPKRHLKVKDGDFDTVTMVESEESEAKVEKDVEIDDDDHVCRFIGFLKPPPTISAEKIQSVHFSLNGRYVGVLHANSKMIHVYAVRSQKESMKKRQRRIKRRDEKKKKKTHDGPETAAKSGQKRGMLDDPESSEDENDDQEQIAEDALLDPNEIKASDEYEYLTTVRATHKVKSFVFAPFKEKGELVRLVCTLATNAFETFSVTNQQEK